MDDLSFIAEFFKSNGWFMNYESNIDIAEEFYFSSFKSPSGKSLYVRIEDGILRIRETSNTAGNPRKIFSCNLGDPECFGKLVDLLDSFNEF